MYNTTLVRRLVTNLARRRVVRVEFTKRDGSHRVMDCIFGDKGRVDRSTVTVFDVGNNGYRSIRKSSLKTVSPV